MSRSIRTRLFTDLQSQRMTRISITAMKAWAASSTWFATAIWNLQGGTVLEGTTWSAAGCCRASHSSEGWRFTP